jgi:RNA polymerase sigma-B factor
VTRHDITELRLSVLQRRPEQEPLESEGSEKPELPGDQGASADSGPAAQHDGTASGSTFEIGYTGPDGSPDNDDEDVHERTDEVIDLDQVVLDAADSAFAEDVQLEPDAPYDEPFNTGITAIENAAAGSGIADEVETSILLPAARIDLSMRRRLTNPPAPADPDDSPAFAESIVSPPPLRRTDTEAEKTAADRTTSAGGDPRIDPRLVSLAAMKATDPRYQPLRRTVIEAHLPLVHHLAQRFRGRGEPYDDLVQVGTIGLLHAVDRFDPSRGSFAAFAVPTIVGEIRRHFRDRGWAMRIPRRVQDLGRRVSEARETLTHNLDRSPTVHEIGAYLGVDVDLVLEALETASAYITVPLPTTPEESDRMAKAFEDSGLELVEQRETLRPLLARLPVREQRILELRFGRGLSQSQIAHEIGVSQMHVSRLLAKSLAVLRSGLTQEL